MCVGHMQPAHDCCLLQANTQVVVSPKNRHVPASGVRPHSESSEVVTSKSESTTDKTEPSMLGRESSKCESTTDKTEPSMLGRAAEWLSSLWSGKQPNAVTDPISAEYKSEIWTGSNRLTGFCRCRILAFEDFSFAVEARSADINHSGELQDVSSTTACNITMQPSNVYVSLQTVAKGFSFFHHRDIPVSFLALLTCLASPSDQQAAKRSKPSLKTVKEGSVALEEENVSRPRTIVRIVVLNINTEISGKTDVYLQQHLPLNHVLISASLRRQLSLSVKGLVAIEPLTASSEIQPTELNFYPLCSPVSFDCNCNCNCKK